MQEYFLVRTNFGRAYRVVRRGYHFVVESQMRDGTWDPLYKLDVGQEYDAEVNALTGAVRKAMFYADDLGRHEIARWMLERASKEAKLLVPAPLILAHLPRDSTLIARVPKQLKDGLKVERKEMSELLRSKLTLSDYVIYRLAHGSKPDVH